MTLQVRTPNAIRDLAARIGRDQDFGAFAYDGFGIMLSDDQLAARAKLGRPGPRETEQTPRWNWLSGGQRAGKTVFGFMCHAEACLYKVGVDNTDPVFWRNYQYKTLNIAPSDELALRLWAVADSIAKGVNDAQYDNRVRRARGGAFLPLVRAATKGRWGIVWFDPNMDDMPTSWIDFRSSEGKAKRLEGTFWRFFTWDEWASQPDGEIDFVMNDVLQGRARDADAKIMPMAWPKAETERHLIAVERAIETGVGEHAHDSQVIYLSAENAPFTNQKALAVERSSKDDARWKRTVLGRTAGGASLEFAQDVVRNMVNESLPIAAVREDGFRYLSSWDLGLARDSTVGLTFRIHIVNGRPIVTPQHKARIVHFVELKGGPDLTIDQVTFEIAREQQAYNSLSAVDATGMGGLSAVRQLTEMRPPPLSFKSRGQDRVYGNMRLAAITNGLDLASWGRPKDEVERLILAAGMAWDMTVAAGKQPPVPRPVVPPWGVIEMPRIVPLIDQMANFDRDAKEIPDDWVWSFLIGSWYIRRYWVQLAPGQHEPRSFDVRPTGRRPPKLIRRVAPVVDKGLRSVVVVRR